MRPVIVICWFIFLTAANPIHRPALEDNRLPALALTDLNGNTYQLGKEKSDSTLRLIHFWHVGDPASMKAIATLNALQEAYPEIQILGIAPQASPDLKAFNDTTDNGSVYHKVRKAFHTPVAQYPLIAQCDARRPHSAPNSVNIECDIISNQFGIKEYPTTLFVDRNGTIKATITGFPLKDGAIQRRHKSWQKIIKKMRVD